ncbi:MAG: phosphotransferase, partial [Clostridia bacterium]
MKLEKVIAVRTNKTVYRDGDLAIKVFSSDYSKSDVLNEALNQARAEETTLNVPTLREVTKIDGKWSLVSDFIAGKTLAHLMEENPDKLDEYMHTFVDLQLLVHKQACPLLNKLKDKMNRKISQSGLDATTRYELHTRLEGMPTHNKLCHGDFDPKNIIIQDDGTAFILDWSHATQGNASADAARTYLLFWLAG